MKIAKILGLSIVVALFLITLVSAYPPLPTEFYGYAKYYGANVSSGVLISAHVAGVGCGTFNVQTEGVYGLLDCRGDDSESSVFEGGNSSSEVYFRINGLNAHAIGDTNWSTGVFKHVNISVPIPFCGDNFCDYEFETCSSCSEDCGNCTPGSGGTGGSGGSGGGSGSGGTGGSGDISAGGIYAACIEQWRCEDWENCTLENLQYRTCSDRASCGTAINKPDEVQECVYEPTCFDGVQNGDETGIDCGGSCGPCLTCNDGIQNQNETGIDCGGPCAPCPTCFDGFRNQNEEGVDCGGPCEAVCPDPQAPLLKFPDAVCEKKVSFADPYLLLFLLIIILAIIARIVYAERKIAEIKKDKYLPDLEKAKKWLSVKRRMYLFVVTIVTLVIIILIYSYFFFLCPTDFLTYLWILLLFLLLSPLIVHQIMRLFEYNEQLTLRRLGRIFDVHYQQIQQLIDIQNEHLMEMEQNLAGKLYKITQDAARQELLEEYPNLKKVYRDLIKLYEKYHEHKTPYGIEKDLCQRIYDLSSNKHFVDLTAKLPEIKEIYQMLRLLYEQYEEKQKLYDELDMIEHPEKYQEEKKELAKKEVPEELASADKEITEKDADGLEKPPEEKKTENETSEENSEKQPAETKEEKKV